MKAPQSILIVEDSKTQAKQLRHLLEAEHCAVACAYTAEEALACLESARPDLIVLDYYLPGMRGDEFCQRLRMKVSTRGIPVLMLTATESDQAEQHSLSSGADDYLPKSVDPDILLLRVRALLRKAPEHPSILGAGDAPFHAARLLAIDDSPTYLLQLTGTLRNEGFAVTGVNGGQEGLAALAREPFDCVLVDLLMPGMDGIEVCRAIDKMRRESGISLVILMLTGHETKEDMTRGLEAGADDFVGKSSDLAVLKARIRALLRRKLFLDENRRIQEELNRKELETVRARAETEAAAAKYALAEKLVDVNRTLEEVNRKLKETQMQLIQSEKMASLGQLVAGIAHEINNPLAFVWSSLFTVRERFEQVAGEAAPHLPQTSLESLEKIRSRLAAMGEGLQRVKDLVTDLRTFSRLDEGEFKTVDVPESIESVLHLLGAKLGDHIRIEKIYGPERLLHCQPGRLNQVMMNLVANAIDAIDGTGSITIRTSQEPDWFVVSVRDTGCGVPTSIRNRIFEPFFTTKPTGSGIGLGLSIAYGIVQSHGGQISFESEAGKGTDFTVRLPLREKEVSAS